MGAAGQDRKPVLGSGCGRIEPQLAQFDPRVVGAAMGLGRYLDLGLQKLPADISRRAKGGGLEQRVRRFRGNFTAFRVGKKVFFLDAELKIIVGRKNACLLARRHQRPNVKSSLIRVELKFHDLVRCLRDVSASQIPCVCNQHSNNATCQSFEWPFGVNSPSGLASKRSI